ncbi:hypothetical protein GLAREA_10401 [Glarea lozoyensis ATCC 20868]|uniref:Uncharacterized protein n=1 Tax=Glarea lozoyensis (strain ATCC 20868 / MF5171) TaxID=1116229 RepID=S3D881_GLAL2|nr:uncharacterized protein GLAREA_10401 [Glarea lozoyensis ATCC 20868]EPE34707.1 hypothetical protein GLAREA_10401 [Glarea lozoyensis ATCC 20868]
MSTTDPETRSVTELALRTITTQIFALASYGNLCSLLNLPKNQHVLYVILFFIYPTIIIGQLIQGFCSAIHYAFVHGRGRGRIAKTGLGFYVQGMFGVYIEREYDGFWDDGNNKPTLFNLGHVSVQSSTHAISWKWFGRMVICSMAVAQAVGTVFLYIRRLHLVKKNENWSEGIMIDTLNGIAAFCSALSGVVALLILVSRLEWKITNRPVSLGSYPESTDSEYSHRATIIMQVLIALSCILGSRSCFSHLCEIRFLFGATYIYVFGAIIVFMLIIWRTNFIKLNKHIKFAAILFTSGICLGLLYSEFIGKLIRCISELSSMENGGWKDPLSDKLFVI